MHYFVTYCKSPPGRSTIDQQVVEASAVIVQYSCRSWGNGCNDCDRRQSATKQPQTPMKQALRKHTTWILPRIQPDKNNQTQNLKNHCL